MPGTEAEQLKTRVTRAIDSLEERLLEIAGRIHATPELNFEERFAADLIATTAEEAGFTVQRPLAGLETAFRATHRGSSDSPTVAFLAEYDALPGIGHACGHNLIGTASLGAALGLAAAGEDVPGTVQLIGTPAEEGGGGKIILADHGVFENVDAALMFHPGNTTELWKEALASRVLRIEFAGKAAHAASAPEEGVNALDATIQTFNGVNALRQHTRDTARIHGIITHGGEAPNIIPEYSAALFYVRDLEDDYCEELADRVIECAHGAARATGSEATVSLDGVYRTLRNNMPLCESFRANLERLGWSFDEMRPLRDLGSSDIGNVSHITPCIHPYLRIGPTLLAFHTPGFAEAAISPEGLRAMVAAAKALALTAADFFTDEDLRRRVDESFHSGS